MRQAAMTGEGEKGRREEEYAMKYTF